ncbi:MAG: MerR family transcriptional regulator [Deltaproteobacteria bacterium]|nr:MerR family transcriptional regulator [Deltaproteobacteria bacterium]
MPDKPFFKIGEAARLCALKPYVLRYWETEFRSIRPQKTRSGQRLYRRQDIEHLLRIRSLLYDQRFTIEGARNRLRELGHDEAASPPLPPPEVDVETMRKMKRAVLELISLVEEP